MDRHYDTAFQTPNPSNFKARSLGQWGVLAVVFFSGPLLWMTGNLVEWALYDPSEGYRFAHLVHPMTQDRVARYWPWAVRVILGANILLGIATFILIRQQDAAREGHPHEGEVRSLEDWLIRIFSTLATAMLVVFFWVSAAAVGYLILKSVI